jgi:hypothetical protein
MHNSGSQWVTVTECPQQCTISWQPSATASPTVCPGTISKSIPPLPILSSLSHGSQPVILRTTNMSPKSPRETELTLPPLVVQPQPQPQLAIAHTTFLLPALTVALGLVTQGLGLAILAPDPTLAAPAPDLVLRTPQMSLLVPLASSPAALLLSLLSSVL